MNQDVQSKNLGQRLWDLLTSVKLSFVLFILLAIASVAGTLIPQNEPPQTYLQAYGESMGHVFLGLGLDDTYHSFWFLTLLCALAVNLICCSLKRLPRTLDILRKDPAAELVRTRKPQKSFTLAGPPEEKSEQVRKTLAKHLGTALEGEDGGTKLFFAQAGGWSRFGVYVVHLSVLIIFAGAMVGFIWGFAGRVNITEGHSIDTITLNDGRPHALGFSVRLDEFTVKYYPDKSPKEFRSDLTFIKNGIDAKTESIRVNHPGEFMGVDFYQGSLGESPTLKVLVTRGDSQDEVVLRHHMWTELPGGGRAGILDYQDHVHMGGRYTGTMARLLYQASAEAQPEAIFAFDVGSKMPTQPGLKFEILEATTVPFSGLQVKYDPGVWFIWVGSTLMVLGFFVAFYFSHRKVWVRLEPADGGRTRVLLAGSANKNRPRLKMLLIRLAAELGAPAEEQGE